MNISNGRLHAVTKLTDGWTRFDWFVSYPINNYNITFNIGKFAHFSDVYEGAEKLKLDYYIMPENLEKARKQFAQVKSMLALKSILDLTPSPVMVTNLLKYPLLGMEYQSAVVYGNQYLNGVRGGSITDVGLLFDFIIIHKSALEWWGDSVTAKDIADMWIHESLATYAEPFFMEYQWDYDAAMKYFEGKKQEVCMTLMSLDRMEFIKRVLAICITEEV